eukprot:875237-Rhodomonas_salina.2
MLSIVVVVQVVITRRSRCLTVNNKTETWADRRGVRVSARPTATRLVAQILGAAHVRAHRYCEMLEMLREFGMASTLARAAGSNTDRDTNRHRQTHTMHVPKYSESPAKHTDAQTKTHTHTLHAPCQAPATHTRTHTYTHTARPLSPASRLASELLLLSP